jgi:hypothetical protein
MQANHPKSHFSSFVGMEVAYRGLGAPPGRNANLVTVNGILLVVKIVPGRDVRPQATMWEACVRGIVKHIDYEKQTISIESRPENWRTTRTW